MSELTIGSGVLDALGARMRAIGLNGRAFLISDDQVYPLYGEKALAALRDAGLVADHFELPAGEASKSLGATYAIYDWLVEQRAERIDAIVALGGGVVGDVAGFVAATFLRGMPLVQVPTTVLAQIDSSIGGKVGVNHPKGKNLIGAFNPARLILSDTDSLRSLPRREIAAGWAEAIKCAMILDAELLDVLEANAASLCDLSSSLVSAVVERCAQHKVRVVTEDERESGLRMILNYGHTIGHALEAVLNYEGLLHGEAVSIGMVGAARLSVERGGLQPHEAARQNTVLARFGLPTQLPESMPRPSVDSILEAMTRDKKSRGADLRWILLDRVGQARVESGVPWPLVRDAVLALLGPERS
ncbi:MAG TPA: 3-dehydroquinate synthase [Chloroflexota bacterium]|nr:3-dehydroquinate synthase [Chloroflexota bacterium]